MLAFCEDQEIKVYLLKMPLAREYVNACDTYISSENYYDSIYAIAKSYSSVKHIFDYQDKYFDEPKYLRNPDHLNFRGAKQFSNTLKQEFAKHYGKH